MRYALVFYILFCIFVGLSGTMQLHRSERVIAAFAFLILAMLVFVFFGLRWFKNPDGTKAAWPPIANMCPDFLTAYTTGTGEVVCVDTIGVSRNCKLVKYDSTKGAPGSGMQFSLKGTFDEKCARAKENGLSWEACDFGPAPSSGGGSGSGACPST
jgi:hypothetical protein